MEHNYVVVDIETTGLSPVKDKIIEIGAIKVRNGKCVDVFSELVYPEIPLTQQITDLTHITDDMLRGKDCIRNVIHRFVEFAEEDPLIGHNIIFDYSFLKTAATKEKLSFERLGIDTLQIARSLHPTLESRRLNDLCEYYGIVNKQHHRAYDDAKATFELFIKLSNEVLATPELLRPKPLYYKPKKVEAATQKQKNYLLDLLKYHKIELRQSMETLTKSEASRWIDRIIFQYGRKQD